MGGKKAQALPPQSVADRALACLARGDAEQAESLLREHLRSYPVDAQGWHAMACVARAGGNAAAAIALAGKAVELAAEPFFYITLGLALLEQGHVEPARAAVNVAVMSTPADPRAHDAMARVMEAAGRLPDAERALQKALSLRPLEQERHMALAAFLARCGRGAEAVAVSVRALALEGEEVLAHNLHAMALERDGRMAQAEPHFAAVAHAMPDNPQALANHGAALFARHRYEEAEQTLQRAATLAPNVAETRTNLGLVHMAQGRLHMAAQELEAAYRLRTHDARLALNYGSVLRDLGRNQAAQDMFVHAMEQARSAGDRAQAALDLGGLYLATGRFAQGWVLWEARRDLLAPPAGTAALPEWDGKATDKTVLLYAEQGLGDTLQFLRYVEQAASRARIRLMLPQSMQRFAACLLPRWNGRVQLVSPAQAGGATAGCSLLSLPHRLGVAEPFAWQPEPACFGGAGPVRERKGLHVGLCWSGNSAYQFDRRRSLDPSLLAQLAGVDGVCFQALQPHDGLASFPLPLAPLPEGDLLATAQLVAGLDVVVSVDTMIVHLAGLLGKPTLLLDRFGGDWRWAAGSAVVPDSPGQVATQGGAFARSLWYPSVRITRQPAFSEGVASWHQPLAVAAEWLAQMAQGGCPDQI